MDRDTLFKHFKCNTRVLTNPRLVAAFQEVDRADFVPRELRNEAYEDYPLPIGFGQTISQPTTVAFMLKKLDVRPGQKILDVGSGSGWTTALLAYLVGEKGKVIGVEIIPELVRLGQRNLEKFETHHSPIRANWRMMLNAEIRQTAKGTAGLPSEAPFDRILVSAAAEKIPEDLIKQLKPTGVLVIPIGCAGEVQSLVKITKQKDDTTESEEFPGFVFVPLRVNL